MQESFELDAEIRTDLGKGASRRLRKTNGVPAIIYGGGKDPQGITLQQNVLFHHLENEAFYSHILSLKVDGKAQKVILRDLQRHPIKPIILHADFLRVDAKTQLRVKVPMHFINADTCVGVKAGGLVTHLINELEISCLIKDLPEFIEVDISHLDIGDAVHLSEITVPKGVEVIALTHGTANDLAVVSIAKPRGANEDEEEAAVADATPAEGEGEEAAE